MKHGSGLRESVVDPAASPAPKLLVELEPWGRVVLRNLVELVLPRRLPPFKPSSRPAPFWPDVFVTSRMPWICFVESALYHVLVLAAVWGFSQLWPHPVQPVVRRAFDPKDVIYYVASEYLPPLDTLSRRAPIRQKGEPEYARQPIISVPPEADNRTQTIVTAPDIKLQHDVPLPNIVAWSHTEVAVPLGATARSAAQFTLPAMPASVVAPPPDVTQTGKHFPALAPPIVAPPPELHDASQSRSMRAPKPAIIEPPPDVEAASMHKLGEINIGNSEVVAPAPQLPMVQQRALAVVARVTLGNAGTQVVPPAPAIQGMGASAIGGRIIALGLHPEELRDPIEPPAGNRRGSFAATPEGRPGAAGTPDIPGDDKPARESAGSNTIGHGNGNGGGSGSATNGIPPGLFVGPGPNPAANLVAGELDHPNPQPEISLSSRLLARAAPPPVSDIPRRPASPVSEINATELEKKVFGERRFYSMTMNMPNLNSVGGSWIIRFAELQNTGKTGELIAPIATQKVDPAYPAEMMRRNVEGTVTLYAVIHSDGSVGDVRVLRGVDERLNAYARDALSRWRFRPATKNGSPVALEAVVMIPFRARSNPF